MARIKVMAEHYDGQSAVIGYTQLVVNALAVRFDGAEAKVQFPGNGGEFPARQNLQGDVQFLRREPETLGDPQPGLGVVELRHGRIGDVNGQTHHRGAQRRLRCR